MPEVLADYVERYINQRYHRGQMHATQMDFLMKMLTQLRSKNVVPDFVDQARETMAKHPETASGLFAKLFNEIVIHDCGA